MKPDQPYLLHILECIRRTRENASPGYDGVLQSHTLQDAILRNLQVLAESTQRLSPELKARESSIDWKAISGLRNVLVHDYFEIDFDAVWRIVQTDLPALESAVRKLLEQTPTGGA